MAIFYNQATLIYGTTRTASNVTTGEFSCGLTVSKVAASTDYTAGSNIVYVVTLGNAQANAVSNVTLTDNLGLFTPEGSTSPLVPLDYVDGSLLFYLNGVLQPTPTVTAGTALFITDIDIPASSTATFVYEVRANEFAPLAEGSSITNTVTATGGGITEALTDSATVPARTAAALTIAKAVCPGQICENGTIGYTFIIQNSGNAEAGETVVLSDTFNPAFSSITVTLDGEILTEGTDYTYDSATGEFSTLPGVITVPAATYTTDAATGVISATPGTAVVNVIGTI